MQKLEINEAVKEIMQGVDFEMVVTENVIELDYVDFIPRQKLSKRIRNVIGDKFTLVIRRSFSEKAVKDFVCKTYASPEPSDERRIIRRVVFALLEDVSFEK